MLAKIVDTLGGPNATGSEINSELDLVDAVRKGFKTEVNQESLSNLHQKNP